MSLGHAALLFAAVATLAWIALYPWKPSVTGGRVRRALMWALWLGLGVVLFLLFVKEFFR